MCRRGFHCRSFSELEHQIQHKRRFPSTWNRRADASPHCDQIMTTENLPQITDLRDRFAALKPRAKAWSLADRSHWAAKCALLAVDRQLASLNCLGELGRRGDLRQNIGGCRGPSWQRKRGSSTLRLRWRAIFFEV